MLSTKICSSSQRDPHRNKQMPGLGSVPGILDVYYNFVLLRLH